MIRFVSVILICASTLLVGAASRASEPAVLIVGGGGPAAAVRNMTIEDLQRLGETEIRTTTQWTDGMQTFTGVTGARFVEALGNWRGSEVIAEALNGYRIPMPFEIFASKDLLIAYKRNGQAMSVRDKGPIWIVFPFDSHERFRTDTMKSYSIWNLNRLDVR